MARYDAALNTLAAEVADIDVVEVSGAISASAQKASAFPFVVPYKSNRQGIFAQNDSMTWAAGNFDTGVSTLLAEQAFTPVGRAYTCTGGFADAVLGQYALADYLTAGMSLTEAVIREGTIGYVTWRDSQLAAAWDEAPTSGPDHTIGGSTSALTKGLIDSAMTLLLTQNAADAERLALVIHTSKIPELQAIPGMADKMIVGGRGGGIGGPAFSIKSKQIVSGYGEILDVFYSNDIVSSTGYHNMMVTVGNGPNSGALANPWHPIITPNGPSPQVFADVFWNSQRRAIEINMSSIEYFGGRFGTASANNSIVDITTA